MKVSSSPKTRLQLRDWHRNNSGIKPGTMQPSKSTEEIEKLKFFDNAEYVKLKAEATRLANKYRDKSITTLYKNTCKQWTASQTQYEKTKEQKELLDACLSELKTENEGLKNKIKDEGEFNKELELENEKRITTLENEVKEKETETKNLH